MLFSRAMAAIAALTVGLVASTGAEAGSRHKGVGHGKVYGGYGSQTVNYAYPALRASTVRVAHPRTTYGHARHSRQSYGYVHVGPAYAHPVYAMPERYAAPVRHARYAPQAYLGDSLRYSRGACNPSPHCVCD